MAYLPLMFETYQVVVETTIGISLIMQQFRSSSRRGLGPIQALFLAWCSKDKVRMEQQEFGKAITACIKAGNSATVKNRPYSWREYSQVQSGFHVHDAVNREHLC